MSMRLICTAVLAAGVLGDFDAAGGLAPETRAGWTGYVAATELRIDRELKSPRRFLAQDFTLSADDDRHSVLGGGIVVNEVETTDPAGRALSVPLAMVHHWRGAVFIPATTVNDIVGKLQSGAPPTRQEDVLESAVLDRGPDWMKVYLRLQKSKYVTVVYNTEHLVRFKRYGPGRASSTSMATKIAEVASPGTPSEHELPPGQDRGFLWRLNSYWRYQQAGAGVIAECESLTLSRPIPYVLTYLVRPIVRTTARESLARTLASLRDRFTG